MSKLLTFGIALAALLGLGGPAATGAAVRHAGSTPARDNFHGTLGGGTGSYRGAHGGVSVRVSAPGSPATRRHLTLVFTGASCSGCTNVSGTLKGYISPVPSPVADRGASYTLSASGRLRSMGVVTLGGTATGTGFIARGYETMQVTLRANRGSVTVSARSEQVPGSTSP